MPAGVYPRKYVSLAEYLQKRSKQLENGCVIWIGSTTIGGYGTCKHKSADGQQLATTAHRASYIERYGAIPDGLEIDHLCKNTLCINPDHLEAVTHLENVQRSEKAGRTHCIHGHEFTAENTYRKKCNGTRVCRKCRAATQLARRLSKKTESLTQGTRS